MYTLTKEELGKRLKQIRQFLSITQIELKEKLNTNQVSISRMESGQGASAELYIKVLCYYSEFIYIDAIFQENFQIVSIDNKEHGIFKTGVNTIAKNMINDAISEYQNSIAKISEELKENFEQQLETVNQELNTKIEKTSNLLSPN